VNEDLIRKIGHRTGWLGHALDRRRGRLDFQPGEAGDEFTYR